MEICNWVMRNSMNFCLFYYYYLLPSISIVLCISIWIYQNWKINNNRKIKTFQIRSTSQFVCPDEFMEIAITHDNGMTSDNHGDWAYDCFLNLFNILLTFVLNESFGFLYKHQPGFKCWSKFAISVWWDDDF